MSKTVYSVYEPHRMESRSNGRVHALKISTRVANLLYIDDLKIFAALESNLNTVLKSTKSAMEDCSGTRKNAQPSM